MATIGVQQNGSFGAGADVSSGREPLTERLLTFAAMAGAVGGALAGATLGVENGAAFPVIWGGFGTMLGSGLTAGIWWLCARLGAGLFGHEDGPARDRATAQQPVNPESRAE